MATSGTISTKAFNTRKVIDHAFRRCKMVPQQVGSEHLDTALDLLFLELSALGNRGIPLWTVEKMILPIYYRIPSIPTPVGTMDVFNINLRTQNRVTEDDGTATASEGVAGDAFDEDLTTACTQTSEAGSITLTLSSATTASTFGILPNASGTWDYIIEGSETGVTYTTLITGTAVEMVEGEWIWEDVEGVADMKTYRLTATGTTILDVTEFSIQNTPQEIPFYKLNRTDYNNLPNKTSTGRPTQFWYDKTRTQPILTMWPSPDSQYTYGQITGYLHRQIEDVGTMQQEIECPQRWYLAIVMQLAKHLCKEVKEVDPSVIPQVEADAAWELKRAWDGESDGSSTFFRPNIRPYTA